MTNESTEHVDTGTPENEAIQQDGVESLLDGVVSGLMGEEPTEHAEEQQEEPSEDTQETQAPAPRKVKVDDETEVDEQELVKGYLRQSDYTRKTQEIAEARRMIEPWKALIEQFQSDPGLVNHVRSYKQQAQQQPIDAPPDDPVEAIKWEAARAAEERVLQRLAPHLETLRGNSVEAKRAHVMARLAADPMANDVRKSMADSLRVAVEAGAMSEQEAEARFASWDRDPDAFANAYMTHRERIARAKGESANEPATTGKTKTETRERAPVLESAAATVPTAQPSAKKQQLRDLKKRATNGDKDAVLDWLEASGAIGNILK